MHTETFINPFNFSQETIYQDDILAYLRKLKQHSRCGISEFQVAALAVFENGENYGGVNIEFDTSGLGHQQTLHAEQFALSLARSCGVSTNNNLLQIHLTAWPCGHCRQFILEASPLEEINDSSVEIVHLEEDESISLHWLLPHAFVLEKHGPSFFNAEFKNFGGDLERYAKLSYSPYTNAECAISVELNNGVVFYGNLIESAAFNPSISPLQNAIIQLVAAGHHYHEIKSVNYFENKNNKLSYQSQITQLLSEIAPNAQLQLITP